MCDKGRSLLCDGGSCYEHLVSPDHAKHKIYLWKGLELF